MNTSPQKTQKNMIGTVIQIIGPVVDAVFEEKLPEIYNALTMTRDDGSLVYLEVEQQLSSTEVRAIALGPTEGLKRGVEIVNTGAPITVPIGEETLGRIFNVVGEAIDGKPAIKAKLTSPIHKPRKTTST